MEKLYCKYCEKECKNKNSLIQHEIRCKENPDKINTTINGFNKNGHKAWNKGLSKETDDRIKKLAYTRKQNIKAGKTNIKGHPHSEETKKKLSEIRKKYLLENPDKHPWKNKNKFISKPCQLLKENLEKNNLYKNIHWIDEAIIIKDRNYSIDICFPQIKLCIEVNGNQHYKKGTLILEDYYQNRENLIKNSGWEIIQIHYLLVYNEEYIKNLINYINNKFKNIKSNFDNNMYNEEILDLLKKKEKIKENKEKDYAIHLKEGQIDSNGRYKPLMISNTEYNIRKNDILNSNIDLTKFGYMKKLLEYFNGKYTARQLRKVILHFNIPHFERKNASMV